MIWRYEKGWVPYEEDRKHGLSARQAEAYYREINQAHNAKTLRDLQDRIVLDKQLSEGDKLQLGNSILEIWKILVHNGHDGKE